MLNVVEVLNKVEKILGIGRPCAENSSFGILLSTFSGAFHTKILRVSNAHAFSDFSRIIRDGFDAVANSAADENDGVEVNMTALRPNSLRFKTANGISLCMREKQLDRGSPSKSVLKPLIVNVNPLAPLVSIKYLAA